LIVFSKFRRERLSEYERKETIKVEVHNKESALEDFSLEKFAQEIEENFEKREEEKAPF